MEWYREKLRSEAADPNRDTSDDFKIENGKLVRYRGPGGDVTVPDGVTAIADGAFSGRMFLRSVRIPDSVTEIGEGVFLGCRELTGVHIPAHLLEGYSSLSAMRIFSDSMWNYPGLEADFMKRVLEGTDDYSEGFRNLFIQRLRQPFYACRWIRKAIEADKLRWVRMILALYEDAPIPNLTGCIDEAAELGKAEIAAMLIQFQHAHGEPDQSLELK